MREIVIEAPAKINLGLNISGVDGTGYHELDTVMAAVPLCDTVYVRLRGDSEIRTVFEWEDAKQKAAIDPVHNSAYAAAKYVRDKFGVCGADIRVVKRVPAAAGLGGSSCDAAAVLRALAELHGIEVTIGDAAKLGSDTAFLFSAAAAARCTGRGEKLEIIEGAKPLNMVIAASGFVNTGACYRKFDELHPDGISTPCDTEGLIRGLQAGDLRIIAASIGNALEAPARALEPEVGRTIDLLRTGDPAAVFMTGSGAAAVGLYKDAAAASIAAAALKGKRDFVFCG